MDGSMKRREILIDGYNVMRKHRSQSAGTAPDAARRAFVEFVRSRCSVKINLRFVFDGVGEAIRIGRSCQVVFSGVQSADLWIRHYLEKQRSNAAFVVVSSDHEVAHHAAVLGAEVMSSESFLASLEERKRKGEPLKKQERSLSASEIEEWKELFGWKKARE